MQVSQRVPEQQLFLGMPSQGAPSGAQIAVGLQRLQQGHQQQLLVSLAAAAVPSARANGPVPSAAAQPQQAPSLLLSRAEIMGEPCTQTQPLDPDGAI